VDTTIRAEDVAAAEAAENTESPSERAGEKPSAGKKGVNLPRLQAQLHRRCSMTEVRSARSSEMQPVWLRLKPRKIRKVFRKWLGKAVGG
jgi:hypothetical protein